MVKLLPIIFIVLAVLSGLVYLFNGNYKLGVYFIAVAVVNLMVIL